MSAKPQKQTPVIPIRSIQELHWVVLSLAIILIALIGMAFHYLSPILKPLFIALFIYFLARPAARFLMRLHFPYWAAHLITILLLIAIFIVMAFTVYHNISQFEKKIPEYKPKLIRLLDRLDQWTYPEFNLKEYVTENLFKDIELEPFIKYMFGTIMSFFANLIVVLIYLLFIILEAQKLPLRIEKAFSQKIANITLEIGHKISHGINNYLLLKTAISLATGITAGVILFSFSLDYWLLWACITFLFNYIPYIGSIAATAFPFLLACLQFVDDPTKIVMIGILLWLTQFFWGNILDPYLAGKYLDVSPLVLLLVLAYWGWLWGIIGMVLAFPLAAAVKIFLSSLEQTRHIAILISSD
ncbi:MAG: AI-2E family transporter [Planctomycetota bacterium]